MYRINICKRRSCVISLHPPTSSNCHSAILCMHSCCSPPVLVSRPSRCLRPCFAALSAIDSFIIPVPIRRIVYGQNHSLNIPCAGSALPDMPLAAFVYAQPFCGACEFTRISHTNTFYIYIMSWRHSYAMPPWLSLYAAMMASSCCYDYVSMLLRWRFHAAAITLSWQCDKVFMLLR